MVLLNFILAIAVFVSGLVGTVHLYKNNKDIFDIMYKYTTKH